MDLTSMAPFKKELLRKSLHLPGLIFLYFSINHRLEVLILLTLLIAFDFFHELLYLKNHRGLSFFDPFTKLFRRGERPDWGPTLLGLGILIPIAFFDYDSAASGILLICISDGVAAVLGKKWGKKKIFYSPKKTYVGSLGFLISSFLLLLLVQPLSVALFLALIATFVESLPLYQFDNLLVSCVVTFLSSKI